MSINSLDSLKSYLKNTSYDITFIQVRASVLLNNNIPSLINTANLSYNKSYEYIDISNTTIATFYATKYELPALLTFKKIKYTDTNPLQPYYVISENTSLNNFINCSLEINSMQSLKDHLTYTTYDITFIRLNRFTSLKGIYIQYIIDSMNVLYNRNYDYFDLDVDEINNFYIIQNNSIIRYENNIRFVTTTYSYNLKALPALLSFKKTQIVNNWIPCRKISGDNIDTIKEFILATLKN